MYFIFSSSLESCPPPADYNCDAVIEDGNVEYGILDFSVIDPDGIENTEFSFSLVSVTPANGTGTAISVENFNINSENGLISIAKALDVDQDKLYNFDVIVRVKDEDNLSNNFTLHLTIEDVNDNDPKPLASSYAGTVCENQAAGTPVPGLEDITFIDLDSNEFGSLVYSLEGAGSNFALLDGTTSIVTARVFDYETDEATYNFSIVAEDKGDDPRRGSASVVVTLCDLNDNRPNIDASSVPVATFSERGPPVTVANVLIVDEDSELFPMQFAIVSIVDKLDDGETLSYDGDIPDSLRVGFDNGRLVVFGEASTLEYSDFLSNVTYENSAGELTAPLSRGITYGVSDMPLNVTDFEASGSGDDDVLDQFELSLFFSALDESDVHVSYAIATVVLQPVNDRPQLNCPAGGVVDPLPSITEDVLDSSNNGTLVSTILLGVITDDDTAIASIGIAVVMTSGPGVWEYMRSGDSDFLAFGNVSNAEALVLGPEGRVRFNPMMHSSGSASLTFKAWDGSDGIAEGSVADTSASESDSSSPFSILTCEAAAEIIPVNDLPAIDLDFGGINSPNYVTDYTENQQPELIFLTDPLNVIVTDVDHSFLQKLIVNISKEDGSCDLPDYPYAESLDYLNINLTIMGVDEEVFTVDKACRNYEYTANLTLQQWEYFIGTLRLSINNTEPSDHTRLVTYSISDGVAFSAPVHSTVSVKLVSDNCPQLSLGQLSRNYVEHSAPIAVDASLTITDDDYKATFSSVEVNIVKPADSSDDFCSTCVLNVTDLFGITSVYSNTTLVLTGPASAADFQSVLRTLTFVDNGNEPSFSSMITVAFTIDDGTAGGCPDHGEEISIVLVPSNDYPVVIHLNGADTNYSTSYTEGSAGVSVVGDIVLEDADTVVSTSYNVTVEIVEGFVSGEDSLFIASGNTITPLEMTDSRVVLEGSLIELSSYLQALRYTNTKSINLATNTRLIMFVVSDAQSVSDSAFTTVDIILVNDPPLLDLTDDPNTADSMVTFSIGHDPVLIASEASITDDSDNMANLTLLLQEIDDDGNALQLRSDAAMESLKFTPVSGISGSYDIISGRLDFTNVASKDDYATLLRSVTYSNTDTDPSLNRRKVVVTVTDEEGSSDTADAYISFTDIPNAPIIDLNGVEDGQDYEVTFTTKEDGPVDLVPNGYIIDVDNDNIVSMVIEYSGASDPCSPSAVTFDNSFNYITIDSTTTANGVRYSVVSDFAGGSPSIVFDKILNGMAFSIGDDASQGTCTLTVQVTDARNSISNKPQVTVIVEVGNEPPYIDLDLGRVGRHFSFVYTQSVDSIAHIVSIRNDSLARNISVMAPLGEAPGEADVDDTEIGVAIISALSHAGYSLTDPDNTELEYLSVRFLYNNVSDVIRYPCNNGTTSGTTGEYSVYGNLSCDPIFTPCDDVIDLCTNLVVKVSSDEYRFEYAMGGTIERYGALLGNLGYQYASENIHYSNFLRTINITAYDGQALSLGSLTTINITRPDDSPVITAPEPPEAAFQIWEDERPNRGFIYYTVPVQNRDGTIPEQDSYEITVTDQSAINETFSVDELGNFRLIGSLDRESVPYYTVPISAHFLSADARATSASEILIEVLDVNDNRPDVQASYNVSVYEGRANEFVVKVVAMDADNGTNARLMYSPLLGRHANLFSVNKTTGVVTTAAPLDATGDDYYLLVLIVQDLGTIFLSTHTVINVYVLPTPPDRLVFDASSDSMIVISENTTNGTTIGSVLAYEIATMDTTNVHYRTHPNQVPIPFNVSDNGEIFVSGQLDAEDMSSYVLTIQAYSNRTDLNIIPAELNVTIIVSDLDENPPEFSPPGPLHHNVLESVQVNTEIYVLTAVDQDLAEYSFVFERHSIVDPPVDPKDFPFDVLSNGSIVTKLPLDAESRTQYSFEVSVLNELGNPLLVSTTSFTVTVEDVNDNAPHFINAPYTANILETAPNGTLVLQVDSTDSDVSAGNREVEYSLLTMGSPFCMAGDTIEVCNSEQLTNYEEDKVFDLNIRASSGSLNNETSASIQLILVNEFPPVFSPHDSNVADSIWEQWGDCSVTNPVASVEVGYVIHDYTATDSDGGDDGIVMYKLVETGVPFSINSSTGVLEVSGCVDAEEETSYSLTVQAVDTDFTVNRTVSITVDDFNDNPPVANDPSVFYVRENETASRFRFGQIIATDADVTTDNSKILFERSESGESFFGPGCPIEDIGIDTDSGELYFCNRMNFEVTGPISFTFEVKMTNEERNKRY